MGGLTNEWLLEWIVESQEGCKSRIKREGDLRQFWEPSEFDQIGDGFVERTGSNGMEETLSSMSNIVSRDGVIAKLDTMIMKAQLGWVLFLKKRDGEFGRGWFAAEDGRGQNEVDESMHGAGYGLGEAGGWAKTGKWMMKPRGGFHRQRGLQAGNQECDDLLGRRKIGRRQSTATKLRIASKLR